MAYCCALCKVPQHPQHSDTEKGGFASKKSYSIPKMRVVQGRGGLFHESQMLPSPCVAINIVCSCCVTD